MTQAILFLMWNNHCKHVKWPPLKNRKSYNKNNFTLGKRVYIMLSTSNCLICMYTGLQLTLWCFLIFSGSICIIILYYFLYTDLERKLSVRTNRDELIKKGILSVTTEGEYFFTKLIITLVSNYTSPHTMYVFLT